MTQKGWQHNDGIKGGNTIDGIHKRDDDYHQKIMIICISYQERSRVGFFSSKCL